MKFWSQYLQYWQRYLDIFICHFAAAVPLLEPSNISPVCQYIIEICQLSWVITVYVGKYRHNLRSWYPDINWDIPICWLIPTYPGTSPNSTNTDGISLDKLKLNKTDVISRDNLTCDFSQDIPRQVCSYSLSLFSIGKTSGWYMSGLVRLTLSILFYTKYQRDIPGKVTGRIILGYLLSNWDMHINNEISQFNLIWGFKFEHNKDVMA